MTPEIDRLANALRMQRDHARALLEHPERDPNNFHLALAGVVRPMLCDAQWPTLLTLARALVVQLRVWGPFPAAAITEKPPSFAFNALIASAEPAFGGHEMSAEEYLDAPVGALTVSAPGRAHPEAKWYTPRQLIKWAANKEGPSHFDPNPVATFSNIGAALEVSGSARVIGPGGQETPIAKNDNFMLRAALLQIAELAVALADQVLMVYEQQRGV
jgi:hypothetical protein